MRQQQVFFFFFQQVFFDILVFVWKDQTFFWIDWRLRQLLYIKVHYGSSNESSVINKRL